MHLTIRRRGMPSQRDHFSAAYRVATGNGPTLAATTTGRRRGHYDPEAMGSFAGVDYELAWPRGLFVTEAGVLIERRQDNDAERVEALLSEAFTSSTPTADFRSAHEGSWASDPWSGDEPPASPGRGNFFAHACSEGG